MSESKPHYLRHGENFVRARRNYMLSAVTLIVIAAADPTQIKIPGLGEDTTLPALLAYAALWFAMAYFAWEYYAEHAYVRLDNSSAAEKADAEDKALLALMRQRIESLSASATQVADMRLIASVALDPDWHRKLDQEAVGGIKGALSQGVWMTERVMTHKASPGDFDPKLFENAVATLSSTVDHKITELTEYYESRRSEFARRVYAIEHDAGPQLPLIAERLRETSTALTALDATYRNVSRQVHATLRIAFRWKDTYLAGALFLTATAMPIVLMSGYDWIWRDW